MPTVEPGYLRKLLPEEAPQDGETWADIQKDIETKVLPGITHWYAGIDTISHGLWLTTSLHQQAIPQLLGLVPLLEQLSSNAGRDVLYGLHGCGFQLGLLPSGNGARDYSAGLAGPGLCAAVLLPVDGSHARRRRDPRHSIGSHRDGHGRGA